MDFKNQNDSFEVLAILLVSQGSSGSHLLFRYPFTDQSQIKNLKKSINNFFKNQILNE